VGQQSFTHVKRFSWADRAVCGDANKSSKSRTLEPSTWALLLLEADAFGMMDELDAAAAAAAAAASWANIGFRTLAAPEEVRLGMLLFSRLMKITGCKQQRRAPATGHQRDSFAMHNKTLDYCEKEFFVFGRMQQQQHKEKNIQRCMYAGMQI